MVFHGRGNKRDFVSRAETIRKAHDTIRYTIQCTQYDTFRDTFQWFAALSWEAKACDDGLRSGAPHSSCPPTGCAVMMCSSYNNGGLLGVFQVQCIWAKFTRFFWIYWLLMWYFFGSFLTLVYVTNVPYHTVIFFCVSRYISVPPYPRYTGVPVYPFSPIRKDWVREMMKFLCVCSDFPCSPGSIQLYCWEKIICGHDIDHVGSVLCTFFIMT